MLVSLSYKDLFVGGVAVTVSGIIIKITAFSSVCIVLTPFCNPLIFYKMLNCAFINSILLYVNP